MGKLNPQEIIIEQKGIFEMKKFFSLLLATAMCISLVACGEKNNENQTGDITLNNNEVKKEASKESLIDFSKFNVGNNPNNFYKTTNPPAFDDSCIYYVGNGDDEGYGTQAVYRIDYKGGNRTCIEGTHSSNDIECLNYYDGNLYYAETDNEMLEIYKVNTNTLEVECICTQDYTYSGRLELYTMIVYKGYIFYAVRGKEMRSSVCAIDINTLETYSLYGEDFEPEHVDAVITFDDEDNIYLYFTEYENASSSTSEVYKCSFADITAEEKVNSSGWGVDKLQLVSSSNYLNNGSVITPYGYMWSSSGKEKYFVNEYADITANSGDWTRSSKKEYVINNSDETLAAIAGGTDARWIIGNSIVISYGVASFDNPSDIYIIKDFKFENVALVGESEAPLGNRINSLTSSIGAYKDKLYIIELDNMLTIVDKDGNVEKYTIN